MTTINRSTRRRLQNLPQLPSVWEGDRRSLQVSLPDGIPKPSGENGDCILWVDGIQRVVRSMEVVPASTGAEVVVRSLLQAMEHPHSGQPGRPTKVVVRDRELQFYLRGILQDLDIKVDCQAELPLINDIFESLLETTANRSQRLSPEYLNALTEKAMVLWKDAPWEYLEDHEVIEVELNHWDLDSLYASIMGMLGMEYGILLYRSLDSLQQFRAQVTDERSLDVMEQAFLSQDCLFMTYAAPDEEDDPDLDLSDLPPSQIEPSFGTIHPLEGMRPLIHEEEASILLVALEALHRFLRQHHRQLQADFPIKTSRYKIPNPQSPEQEIVVQVKSRPDIAEDLMGDEEEDEDDLDLPELVLHEGLVPDNSQLGLGMIPWQFVEHMRQAGSSRQPTEKSVTIAGDGLPVVIVQTSRPKAKILIDTLQQAGGLKGICFNTGIDPFSGERYDLEILQTGNGDLHLIGEFLESDPTHAAARKKWDQRCKKTGGYCGLLVAMGVTSSKQTGLQGLQTKHLMALFEVPSVAPDTLGLGPLVKTPHF